MTKKKKEQLAVQYCKHCGGPSTYTVNNKRPVPKKDGLFYIDGVCNKTKKRVSVVRKLY